MTSCETCSKGGVHLDTTTPPEIIPLYSDTRIFYKKYNTFRKNYKDKNLRLYAITLTISSTEYRCIKLNDANQSSYLLNKLIDKKINGIFVEELTKKNRLHLHGFTFGDKEIMNHKCRQKGYYLPDWGASNVLKPLSNEMSIDKWCEYITKTMVTPNIIKWLNPVSPD